MHVEFTHCAVSLNHTACCFKLFQKRRPASNYVYLKATFSLVLTIHQKLEWRLLSSCCFCSKFWSFSVCMYLIFLFYLSWLGLRRFFIASLEVFAFSDLAFVFFHLWSEVTWIQICACLNHRKKMEGERSRLIPGKPVENLELLFVGQILLSASLLCRSDRHCVWLFAQTIDNVIN